MDWCKLLYDLGMACISAILGAFLGALFALWMDRRRQKKEKEKELQRLNEEKQRKWEILNDPDKKGQLYEVRDWALLLKDSSNHGDKSPSSQALFTMLACNMVPDEFIDDVFGMATSVDLIKKELAEGEEVTEIAGMLYEQARRVLERINKNRS